jgi:hypothetical protein
MIHLEVILSFLHLVLKILVGASGDFVNGSKGSEIGVLLGRFLVL